MLKKVLIGTGVFLVLFIAANLFFFFYWTRLGSPMENVHYESPELAIEVSYCRPSKKGRLIFGDDSQGALVKFGKYWRLGANQSTEIQFSSDVVFAGKEVKAGHYRMYAIPGADSWIIRLNSELGVWGASEPDYTLDIAEISVPVKSVNETELFTITADEIDGGLILKMFWDQTMVEIPIQTM